MPLDPVARLVVDQLAAAGGKPVEEMSPPEAREMFEAMRPPGPGEPVAHVEDRRIPGPAGAIPVRIYRPEGARGQIVFFHGGGWVIGSLETVDIPLRSLANASGATVVSVDYRLAPEHRHPAAAEDCFAATRWAADAAAELSGPGGLAVGGDSAGGNLAAVVALLARARGGPRLAHQLLVYPVTDADFARASYRDNADGYLLTRAAMQWFWDHYVPDTGARDDETASPLRAKNLAGLPPATVYTAEFDPLRDEGEAYAARLREDGVPVEQVRWDGMIHGFFGMPTVFPQGHDAIARAGATLRAALRAG